MKNNLTLIRIYIGREADASLGRIADTTHRTKQRQTGLMLERVAQMFRESPQKLADLGLLNPPNPFTPAPPAQ